MSNSCYHCGEQIADERIEHDSKEFCCTGCKTVYEILNENDLCKYYDLEATPGINPSLKSASKFDYLRNDQLIDKLIDFKDDSVCLITFLLPQIHCSSCVWLLENLSKLNPNIISSRVNFLRKELKVSFKYKELELYQLAGLLSSIGYEPSINLNDLTEKSKLKLDKGLIIKLGVAGFCFGNIMLISLPEYFGLDFIKESSFARFFGYVNLILSLPVFFYSATDYLKAAWNGLKHKNIVIDIPISLGILVLFARSAYEVLANVGAGYFDSLAGLIFFLLLGKVFQQKTYNILSFERDYKSYFPVATIRIDASGNETSIPVSDVNIGDTILVKNHEIIPVDAVLMEGNATIDNSFITGEFAPVQKVVGDRIYAGGKQLGQAIKLSVVKELSHSYFTQLWNDEAFSEQNVDKLESITNVVSKYFTIIILFIALASGAYWWQYSMATAINSFTAVLIIACPCALALSAPFTFGNALRILGRNKFYIKNASVIEAIASISTVVLDKTGTITQSSKGEVKYLGMELSETNRHHLYSIFRQSSHPLSKIIYSSMQSAALTTIEDYKEVPGSGMEATVDNCTYVIGSEKFVQPNTPNHTLATRVYIRINNKYYGFFQIENKYRARLKQVIETLSSTFNLFLLSGDNDSESTNLRNYFNEKTAFFFNQTPEDKLAFIKSRQEKNEKVLMIGDGLNDSGALKQSEVGISISENVNTFSPACDVIMDATTFDRLPVIFKYCKSSITIIIISFIISFLYNIIGLTIAVQGLLSPIFAAILMPISSITVVVFVTMATNLLAKRSRL